MLRRWFTLCFPPLQACIKSQKACSPPPDAHLLPAPPLLTPASTQTDTTGAGGMNTECSSVKNGIGKEAPAQESDAVFQPAQQHTLFDVNLEAKLMRSMTFSVALLSSDAKNVLYQCGGNDPAAALLLSQALQFKSLSCALNSPQTSDAAGSPPRSFLAAILGPELEAVALDTAQQSRYWKGTISVQLPADGFSSCSDAARSFRFTPEPTSHANKDTSGLPNWQENKDLLDTTKRPATTKEASLGCLAVAARYEDKPGAGLSWESQPKAAPKQQSETPSGSSASHALGTCSGSTRAAWCGFDESEERLAGLEKVEQEQKQKPRRARVIKSSHSSRKLRVRRNTSSSYLGRRILGSHIMSERAIKRLFKTGNCGEKSRAVALLASISQSSSVHGRSTQTSNSCKDTKSKLRRVHSAPLLSNGTHKLTGIMQPLTLKDETSKQSFHQEEHHNSSVAGCIAAQGQEVMDLFNNQIGGARLPEPQDPLLDKSQSASQTTAGPSNGHKKLDVEPIGLQKQFKPSKIFWKALTEDSPKDTMTFNFDVMVTMLETPQNCRSPLLVVMYNSTDHMRARGAFLSLAESQLELLASTMPLHAVQFLATKSTKAVPTSIGQLARKHTGVTLLFMDIVGFTSFSKSVEPEQVMALLNTLFSLFDKLVDEHGVHKVETAGDCYIVSGGIMSPNPTSTSFGFTMEDQDPSESAARVMGFAKGLLEAAKQVNMPGTNQPVQVQVGMHTGDVVSGLIGSKLPKFSLFGDPMNTASRMESTGVPGRIHVSEATCALLPNEQWEPTRGVEVKGKGPMQTYLWTPPAALQSNQPKEFFLATSPTAEPLASFFFQQACTLVQQAQGDSSCPLPSRLLADLRSFSTEVGN